jgi:hypothetical protein
MSERKKRIIESLTGTGNVYKDNEVISDVQYRLQITQEFIISRSHSSTEELPGLKEISGQIDVISGERDLMDGNMMTLQLKDGRKWKFFAPRGDFISGSYQVVSASGDGIISE